METGGRQIIAIAEGQVADRQAGRVYVLVTVVDDAIMAAVHATREGAMTAAVDWVQGEAETRMDGGLDERYEKAQRHVERQGGQMEIVSSPLFSQPND